MVPNGATHIHVKRLPKRVRAGFFFWKSTHLPVLSMFSKGRLGVHRPPSPLKNWSAPLVDSLAQDIPSWEAVIEAGDFLFTCFFVLDVVVRIVVSWP